MGTIIDTGILLELLNRKYAALKETVVFAASLPHFCLLMIISSAVSVAIHNSQHLK